MSLDLSRFFVVQQEEKRFSEDQFPKEYTKALKEYWAGKFTQSLGTVSGVLADNPDHTWKFPLYRLWIENLAELGEISALSALEEHLENMGEEDIDNVETYFALRGICHYEMDHYNAATLFAKSIVGYGDNPYCLELSQLVTLRTLTGPIEKLQLASCTVGITDYVTWQTLAVSIYRASDRNALQRVLSFLKVKCPNSPLHDSFDMHQCIASSRFSTASETARKMGWAYPSNLDYKIVEAYSLIKQGDLSTAKDLLLTALPLVREHDPDIFSMLAYCYGRLGEKNKDQAFRSEAVQFLKNAKNEMQKNGFPVNEIEKSLTLFEAKAEISDEALANMEPAKAWLIRLSARRYNELRTSNLTEIDKLLRPMGNKPKVGDLCFFAYEETPNPKATQEKRWKIGAIYTVASAPVKDPMTRYKCALELVHRLPVELPVDVHILDEDHDVTAMRADKGHPYHFGVFELEGGALDIITKSVESRRMEGEPSDVTTATIENMRRMS